MSSRKFRIGTRKSELAMAQAEEVTSTLKLHFPDMIFEIVPATTTGDRRRDELDLNVQDKKQWIIELEQLLSNNEIDIAVHSAKDVPLQLQHDTRVTSILKRERAEDILVLNSTSLEIDTDANTVDLNLALPNLALSNLRPGARIGTSSNRRRSELLRIRPDLEIVPCRGNVPTRIKKLEHEQLDGIVIALAGINRLNIKPTTSIILDQNLMMPSSTQGTLIGQYRSDDKLAIELLSKLIDKNTQIEFEAERACIDILGADCHTAIGVRAILKEEVLKIAARILSKDGQEFVEAEIQGNKEESGNLGKELGEVLIAKGALRLV